MPSQTDIKNILSRLNLDDSPYYLGQEDYVDALNITHDAQEQSEDIAITNITGNRIVEFTKPSGTNVTIGAKADLLRNRVFEFLWNSNDHHCIIIYDNTTRTRTKLIENIADTGGIDVLQFTLTNKIIHVDIIYRDLSEGDLVFWTDGNVTPKKINVKHIQDGIYSLIKTGFIELAKKPPINPAIAVYGSDLTKNSNSLRKKLVQVTYRFSYDDYEKSTFTTYSKVPLPIGYYGSDNDIDNTKNNFITLTVETGDENVTDIEIAVRFNTDNAWDDFILAVSLNKDDLSIPDNTTYDYLFYNDNIYPPIDIEEATQLFDWVPKKAKSQCSPNGNVIAFGAYTENYPNIPVGDLDVTITAANVTNVPPDTDPPSLTYYFAPANTWTFTVNGSVPTGTVYQIYAIVGGGNNLFAYYVSGSGNTTSDVATGLGAYISAHWASYFGSVSVNSFIVNPPVPGFMVTRIDVVAGGGGGASISTEKTWLWDCNYIFGLAYKDEQGRLIPGVTTFTDPTDSDNDFSVTTPSFSLSGADVQTPVISAFINHLPPADAVTYAWVRRRMNYGSFLMYETCDYQDLTDGYLYFCLANIETYKEQNSQFIYGTAPITSESRLKIIAGVTSGAYNGNVWNQDYEILGLVTKTLTGGTSPGDDRLFIKVVKPTASISPAYEVNMLVMVYTPMANPTSEDDSIYSEWSEEYSIYVGTNLTYSTLTGTFSAGEIVTGGTSGATGTIVSDDGATGMTLKDVSGVFVVGETITGGTSGATAIITVIATQRYHSGQTQDQSATQKAEFVWEEGDVYFHVRTMFPSIVPYPTGGDALSIMDSNFSDFFLSAVNDNGRGLTIEVNARETYFPASIRFGLEYQDSTNINQTNRFYYNNFIDLDRSFGSILKMSIKDRFVRIGQQYKIGTVPIYNQISKDSAGNTLLASTDVLLNPVQYYLGDYGVGDAPECWVDYNYSSYFFDTNRGIWCRLSRDGITPTSILYKINSWATTHGVLRGNEYKIYGAFDPKSNNCIFSFEATNTDPAYTLSFDEDGNAFESFLSYHPEMMCVLGSLLITWKDGDLWTHDASVYNNFYGTQYESSIEPVFNDKAAIKKKYLATGHKSLNNVVWESSTNGDITTSAVNPQTGLVQISQLATGDYDLEETTLTAAFLYDANSGADAAEALVNGDFLGGNYLKMKFTCPSANCGVLINLQEPYITWIVSQRNF